MLQKILYYPKRIQQLGLRNTLKRIQARADKKIYKFYWKKRALKFQANHGWETICATNNISKDFNIFFEALRNKSFLDKILHDKAFNQTFNLNSEPNLPKNLDWHQQFESLKNTFYQDIKINLTQKFASKELGPDIKNPWELSRFQHLFALGTNYEKIPDENLAKLFKMQIDDWINSNPFLLSVNWVCPMEVAIRAINLIYGFHYFKNSPTIPLEFWQKIICSLYDHAKYLENNWETSDKPNNHYLSDLLGYFYLCFFFEDLKYFEKEKTKILNKILDQFEKQVHPDGTCYEGSTNYHKLVTEIFLHFSVLCKTQSITLPKNFEHKLQKMLLFMQDCSDSNGNLVQIGDNDSGKILTGVNDTPFMVRDASLLTTNGIFPDYWSLICIKKSTLNSFLSPFVVRRPARPSRTMNKSFVRYPNFGLTIIKNQNLHITFRHPTFSQTQPSGHFHQDAFAITLSINGIPVLVDPGTYVYTANAAWRNFFRSIQNHNTFYIEQEQNFYDLFQLQISEQKDTAQINETSGKIEVENFCNKYQNLGFIQNRKLTLLKGKNSIEIQDWWEIQKEQTFLPTSYWTLIFHPQIKIEKENTFTWKLIYKNFTLTILESNLEFEKQESFYSEKYGSIEKCTKLVASKKIDTERNLITFLNK